jgi:hypothetical protein
MRAKVLAAACLAIATAVYVGLSAHVLLRQDIQDLLVCADQGGLKIPLSRSLCREYLFAFRGTTEDIASLHQGVGASFVLQGRAPLAERERILDFLVGKGLDVNRIDMHKLRPLHAAVLSNAPEEVVVLLRHGARAELPDERYGQTPLELALALERDEHRQAGREDLIAMLRSAH